MKHIKTIKFIIIAFFLICSFWVTGLIFERGFAHKGMAYSVDSEYENTLMILLVSTLFSAVGVFLLGLLTMFYRYIFIKLIFVDEIRQAAYLLVVQMRKDGKNTIPDLENIPPMPDTEEKDHTIYS